MGDRYPNCHLHQTFSVFDWYLALCPVSVSWARRWHRGGYQEWRTVRVFGFRVAQWRADTPGLTPKDRARG